MAGLTNSLTYYAIFVNPTTIKLALNPARKCVRNAFAYRSDNANNLCFMMRGHAALCAAPFDCLSL